MTKITIDGFLVYYSSNDNEDIDHQIFIEEEDAISYALELGNKYTGNSFRALTEMDNWFNDIYKLGREDPGQVNFYSVKIKN